jgi:hypothetical protein
MRPDRVEHPYIHFNGTSGYSRHGDTVSLFADRIDNLNNTGLTSGNLALQLWACQTPYIDGGLTGRKLAELPLGVLQANHFLAPVQSDVPAYFPEFGDYAIALVVAEWDGEGFNRIHDVHNYPNRDIFLHPRLDGLVGYRCVDERRLVVDVGRIHNPRDLNNMSGTLSLELWALPEPYVVGDFAGHALAGVTLGSLAGGASRQDCTLDLEIIPPPAGTYTLVLMLREWIGNGYVTRDHSNFSTRVTFPIVTSATQSSESVIVDKSLGRMANTARPPEQEAHAVVARSIEHKSESPPSQDFEQTRATQGSKSVPTQVLFDNLKRFAQRLLNRVKQQLSL